METVNKNLSTLEGSGLIRVAQLEPDIEYIFRHELIRDAIYTTIVKTSRRDLHKATAEAIEKLYPDRKDTDLAAVLAQHFAEAQESDRAVHYATLAGDNAYSRYANTEACLYFRMALTHAQKLNDFDRQIELFRKLGHALEHTGQQQEAIDLYEQWRSAAQKANNQLAELEAVQTMLTQRSVPTLVYDAAIAQKLGDEAIVLARKLGDRKSESAVLWNLSSLSAHTGNFRESVHYGEESLAIARELDAREQIAYTLNDLASFAYIDAGQLERGKVALREARELWIELDNKPMLGDCLATTTRYDSVLGNYDEVLALSKEALDLAEATNNPWGRSYSRFVSWRVMVERGDIGTALEEGELCLEWAKKAGFAGALVGIQSEIGLILAQLGHLDEGLKRAEESLEVANSVLFGWRGWPLSNLALIHVLRGDLKSAQRYIKEGKTALKSGFFEASPALVFSEVAFHLAKKKPAEALKGLLPAHDRFVEVGAKGYMASSFATLAQVLIALNRKDEAREALQQARTLAEKMGARWSLWQILAAMADLEGDESLRKQAAQHLTYVVDHITDNDLRASFLRQPRIKAVFA